MASALGELVDGYSQAQELKMKKAREIANQQADKFEREYKLSQAKQQAEYQGNELKIRQREVETQAQYALVAKQKADEQERKDKEHEKFQTYALDIKQQMGAAGTDFKKWQTVWQSYLKERDGLIYKGKIDPLEADRLTQWLLSKTDENIIGPQGTGYPVPMPGSQPGQQGGVNAQLLNALHTGSQMLGGAPPPVQPDPAALLQHLSGALNQGHMQGRYAVPPRAEGMPDSGGVTLPGQQAELDRSKAQTTSAFASAAYKGTLDRIAKVTEEATRLEKTALAKKYNAQAKVEETKAKHQEELSRAEIDRIVSQTAASGITAKAAKENADTNAGRLALEAKKYKDELNDPTASSKVADNAQKKVDSWRKEQTTDQEKIGKAFAEIAKLKLLTNPRLLAQQKDPETQKPIMSEAEAIVMSSGATDSLNHQMRFIESLVRKDKQLEADIHSTQLLINEAKKKKITTPGGETDPKATAAAAAAARANAEKARRASDAANRASGETLPHNTARNPSRHTAPKGKVLKLKSGKSFKVERVPD